MAAFTKVTPVPPTTSGPAAHTSTSGLTDYPKYRIDTQVVVDIRTLKAARWVGSSREDLRSLPKGVRQKIGFALYFAQQGQRHESAKVLRGFGDAGVLEIVEVYDRGAYRAVYTVRFASAVYVLHVFRKKSKHGITTPWLDVKLIKARLNEAVRMHAAEQGATL